MFIENHEDTDTPETSLSDALNQPSVKASVLQRLAIIEATVKSIESLLQDQRQVKEWYTVAEAAQALGKADFTVREWCRHGRVNAHKRPCGRGRSQEWIISNDELERIRNKGLLPAGL